MLTYEKKFTWSKAHELKVIKKELTSLQKHMKEVLKNMDYEDLHASIILPVDKKYLKYIKSMIIEKKMNNYDSVIVIGIGGSNLGTIAVQEAILGKNYPSIFYADTVDPENISRIIKLNKLKKVLLNVISKSGKTTETIANFEILKEKLNIKNKDIVITTDRDSKLWDYAFEKKISVLEIPSLVGGRYSVFSAVGLFPLGMIGINIDKLIKGAYEGLKNSLSISSLAVKSASEIYIHYKSGLSIHNTFLFANDLESIGKWYRQLMGESLGKEFDLNKKQIFMGITPTFCVGSVDLHSMGQQYLGGPFDTFTTFVSVKNRLNFKVLGKTKILSNIKNKSLSEIMEAILKGVKIAYRKQNRPFVSFVLKNLREESIGYFIQIKMIEMMFLGHLLNVNPFDQPNVELYKKETRKLLN